MAEISMGFYQPLLGKRFGRIKVTREEDRPGWVLCVCGCGKYRSVMVERLLRGEIKECVALQMWAGWQTILSDVSGDFSARRRFPGDKRVLRNDH